MFIPAYGSKQFAAEKFVANFCASWDNMYLFLAFTIIGLFALAAILYRVRRHLEKKKDVENVAMLLKIQNIIEQCKEEFSFFLVIAILVVWWFGL